MNKIMISALATVAAVIGGTANAQTVSALSESGVVTASTAGSAPSIVINGRTWRIPATNAWVRTPYTINGVASAGPIAVGSTCSFNGSMSSTPATTMLGRPVPASTTYSVPVTATGTSSIGCTR